VAFDAIWAGDDSTIFLSEQQGFEAKAVWFIELLRGGTTRASRLLMEAKDSGATLLLRRLPSYPFVLIERKRPDGNQFAAAYSSGNGALISAMTPFEGGVHYSAYGAPDEVVIVKHGPVRDALYRLPAQDFDWDQRRLGFEAKDYQFIEGVYPFQKRLLLLTRSLSEISIDALTLDNVLTNTCRLPGITRVREASIQGGDEISFGVGVLNRKSLITVTGDPHGCRVTELAPSGVQEAITLVPARDKTIIPVLTLTPAGKITGTLVQFYGSYGVTAWPTRTKLVNALLERQIQIVVPFVRGSGFMGPRWYESGRAGNKTNSFNDAEDVLRTLKAAARPLLLRGRSAGAALATTTADRLRGSVDGLILEYPVVDLVHTVSGKGMPLTERETLEWGELARPENAMTLRAISPRHLVDPQLPKLVLTLLGVDDPLVPIPSYLPWLAATRADERISLVSTFDTKGGHGDDLDQGSEEEWWALIVRAFEELQTGAP
jgi:protease II